MNTNDEIQAMLNAQRKPETWAEFLLRVEKTAFNEGWFANLYTTGTKEHTDVWEAERRGKEKRKDAWKVICDQQSELNKLRAALLARQQANCPSCGVYMCAHYRHKPECEHYAIDESVAKAKVGAT